MLRSLYWSACILNDISFPVYGLTSFSYFSETDSEGNPFGLGPVSYAFIT